MPNNEKKIVKKDSSKVVKKVIREVKPKPKKTIEEKPIVIDVLPEEEKPPLAVNKHVAAPSKKKSSINNDNKTYATGKRKNAIAKVWLFPGTGKIVINGKTADAYLKRAILETIINQPFQLTNTDGKFDIICTALGGGLSGQAGAIRHAISVALQLLTPDLRDILKRYGFLTRDSRVVERKKPGLKKARKGQVYQRR
jgi:small subunit ribosomal protein S9